MKHNLVVGQLYHITTNFSELRSKIGRDGTVARLLGVISKGDFDNSQYQFYFDDICMGNIAAQCIPSEECNRVVPNYKQSHTTWLYGGEIDTAVSAIKNVACDEVVEV